MLKDVYIEVESELRKLLYQSASTLSKNQRYIAAILVGFNKSVKPSIAACIYETLGFDAAPRVVSPMHEAIATICATDLTYLTEVERGKWRASWELLHALDQTSDFVEAIHFLQRISTAIQVLAKRF